MIGIGISVAINNYNGSLGQTIALNHYNRVTAAGGVLPCGVASLAAIINAICTALGLTTEAQFQAAVPQGLDPHYSGYLAGAGSGVTLGQACQKIFNWAGASGDVSQGTAGSQPLLLAYTSGNNYGFIPNITGNSFTANSGVSFTSASDTLILKAKVFLNNQGASGTFDTIGGQGTLYNLQITNAGTSKAIRILGSTASTASSSYTPSETLPHWVRATLTPSGITYEWSADDTTWTAIGTSTLPTYGSGTTLIIGGSTGSTANVMSIYSFEATNSTTSTYRIFNPNSYNAATSQTNWASTTGEVWTLNVGTATTGYKACIVDRTICQGDGVDDKLTAAYNRPNSLVQFAAYRIFAVTAGGGQIFDSTSNNGYNSLDQGSSILARALVGFSSAIGINVPKTLAKLDLVTMWLGDSAGDNGMLLNNGSSSVNTSVTSTPSGTGLTLFGRASGAFANATINTYILTDGVLNTTKRTSMYDVIRSMNNNAF
jgi:hypothetical protein